ncbi:hypothetical protein BV898_16340 [Hypsibius exemplaris]|uniref:Uncharacterized protein n=1 Tax=Hypsibius exemplaris TaxID=2072580 RepID=A0A9X6NLS8_HYPEX|nr:hypothetical protein BV898_16340 [Hypsibius exemplaris]
MSFRLEECDRGKISSYLLADDRRITLRPGVPVPAPHPSASKNPSLNLEILADCSTQLITLRRSSLLFRHPARLNLWTEGTWEYHDRGPSRTHPLVQTQIRALITRFREEALEALGDILIAVTNAIARLEQLLTPSSDSRDIFDDTQEIIAAIQAAGSNPIQAAHLLAQQALSGVAGQGVAAAQAVIQRLIERITRIGRLLGLPYQVLTNALANILVCSISPC